MSGHRMLRAVLFDLDGVLVDSYEVWFHLMNAAAGELRYPAISRELFQTTWGQGVQADIKNYYPGKTVEDIEAYYNRHFMDHVQHIQINPEAANVLSSLKARGIKTSLITNTPAPLAREILEFAALELDTLVGGTDVPQSKPAPDMILKACTLLGVGCDESLVVGDSRFDRDAAAAAAVRFAGLGIKGDVTLQSLSDLLGITA